jgi:hypothetical protein
MGNLLNIIWRITQGTRLPSKQAFVKMDLTVRGQKGWQLVADSNADLEQFFPFCYS